MAAADKGSTQHDQASAAGKFNPGLPLKTWMTIADHTAKNNSNMSGQLSTISKLFRTFSDVVADNSQATQRAQTPRMVTSHGQAAKTQTNQVCWTARPLPSKLTHAVTCFGVPGTLSDMPWLA